MKIYIMLFLLLLSATSGITAQSTIDTVNQLIIKAGITKDNGDLNTALELYTNISILAHKSKSRKQLVQTLKNIGDIYRIKGKQRQAIKFYKKCENLYLETSDFEGYAKTLENIGVLYANTTQNDSAFYYFEKALMNIDTVNNKKGVANIMKEIGGCYFKSNDADNAMKFYTKAYKISNEIQYYSCNARALNGIGNCYALNKNYKKALLYRQKALKIMIDYEIQSGRVSIYNNLGNNLMRLKQYDSARYYMKKAENLARSRGNINELAMVNHSIADLYIEKRDYNTALLYLEKGFVFVKKSDDIFYFFIYCKSLYETYKAMKDYKNSLIYLEEYMHWTDSITKTSTKKKLEEFKIKYETTQKEQQIVALSKESELKTLKIRQGKEQHNMRLLILVVLGFSVISGLVIWHFTNKNRVLSKQENIRFKVVIEAEQQERKRIAQDLHDSLGQAISVIMMTASNLNVETSEEKKHQKLLNQIDKTYEELRNISQNIMPNTLITLGLIPALRELIEEMSVNQDLKIILLDSGDFKDLNEAKAIALYRIIQEALSNIIKHAQASDVIISFKREKDKISLSIKDNGLGLNTSKINDFKGLGWKNILSRVALLSGDVDINSSPEKGTHLSISLSYN